MSSGAQIDMDWAGLDAASGGSVAPPANGANGAGAGAEKYLTDEEILGIEPVGESTSARRDVIPSGARNPSGNFGSGETQQRDSSGKNGPRNDDVAGAPRNGDAAGAPNSQDSQNRGASGNAAAPAMPEWMAAAAGDPLHGAEAQKLWQEHQAFRASFSSPEEARAIRQLFPGGAQEAQTLRQAAQAVDQLDAAIYSGDARAQSEVVAELARANPAAFRQLFSEAANVLAGLGQALPVNQTELRTGQPQPANNQPPTLSATADEGWGTQQNLTQQTYNGQLGNAAPSGNSPGSENPGYNKTQAALTNHGSTDANHASPSVRASESPVTKHQSPVTGHQSPHASPQFDPAAYAAFERSTNDTVARDVRVAVGDTLTRVLPEGIADGAARRIGDDIFNEIHRTLASDRTLSEQIGEILRGSARESTANGWRFGMAEQQRVASLLASRAKQLVPGVTRRVIGEWTSSVLGASRSKSARQASAAARVDIAAAGGSLDSTPLRPMSNREIDYASMSDDQILGM
jgi:hypothetical protein